MEALPTGTVTLLFTDIEGSTRLLQSDSGGYAERLAEHHRLLRAAFARHHGVEVDTAGDAFFVAFASPTDALAAAREGQRALAASGGIRVRMGLHTGEPQLTEGGYVGIDVHRAARVADAGHGGQILLTEATRALLDDDGLRDLGIHRLKDVGAFRLYQDGHEAFPELRAHGGGNLPDEVDPLVGRSVERKAIDDLFHEDVSRLVTLVGPGGVGKTRLALQSGRDLVEDFLDGVWFVDLSPIADPEQFEAATAAAIGATSDLTAHLRDRRSLLILDNFEQLARAADHVSRLLEACPKIGCIVTSREALHVRGERVFPVRPLEPDASIELFRDRAEAVAPGFEAPTELLALLCERLDRMPLAIELAAARVRLLDAEQLLERLDRRLPVLTGGARDAPERQRTLRATIEWSIELLEDDERALFDRLGVFVGGCDLDAAEVVCHADLDTLQALVDKSLISADRGRLAMLGSIREFAAERLRDSREAEDVRARHARHFADLAARAAPQLTGPDQHVWLDRIADDYENLRAAFAWLADAGDGAADAVNLAGDLVFYWYIRGRYDGLEWLERALALCEGERTIARARVAWGAGFLFAIVAQGDRAGPLMEVCLEIAREHDDTSLIARSLDVLGILAFFQNDLPGARAMFEEAIGFARAADDRWCLADCLGTMSSIYPLIGEFSLAVQAGTEALEIARGEDDRQGIRMALFGLALTRYRLEETAAARSCAEEGLAICRQIGDTFFTSYFLWILALAATEIGEIEVARGAADEALELAELLEVPLLLVCALEASAAVARAEGDDRLAWDRLQRADEIARGGMVPSSYSATVARSLGEIARSRGDEATADELLGRSLTISQAVHDVWGVERSRAAMTHGGGA